ncbi:hypothetical protein CXB51_002869 [Gossypium anomalum]|uniref:Zinc finger Sec23/Sec24-type domain-containing protein n=1 Tax=Gossypium anomalum TaxID=47600 RepID=A0A8J6DBC2_9ROSI|nr:hypothetical protein CXB51_002869 [Gossypium anomalum]
MAEDQKKKDDEDLESFQLLPYSPKLLNDAIHVFARLCDCSSQPLLTIPEVDKKVMPGMENEGSNLSRPEEIKNQANEAFKGTNVMSMGYVGIHSSGFRDFLPKPELLRSIVDSGFKHPFEGKVMDFGESGPIRCSRCKGYINPFMKFIDQERKFICNLCGQ